MGIEIERKFLVEQIPAGVSQGEVICQGYMVHEPDRVVRVRTKGEKGYLTVKGKTIQARRLEFEYEIPFSDARQMLELLCEKPFVEKTRYEIEFQGFEWVIDLFSGENSGLILAEIELDHSDQVFGKPPWAGAEVTHDPRYFNSNLVRHPYVSWQQQRPGPAEPKPGDPTWVI